MIALLHGSLRKGAQRACFGGRVYLFVLLLATNQAAWAAKALPKAPRPLALSYGAEPATLDPANAADSVSADFVAMLYAGLVRAVGPTLALEPDLATHWQVSADARRYTFFLRKSAWSDGTPLTAHDFVFAVRRALARKLAAANAHLLFDIANAERCYAGELPPEAVGIEALDDQTLSFALARPAPWFLQLCAHTAFKAVPAHVLAKEAAWPKPAALVTSGPYRVERWRFRRDVALVPNAHHYAAAAQLPLAAHFLFVPRPEVGMALFLAGELDVSPSPVPLPFMAWAEQQGPMLQTSDRLASDFYWLNTARPPLDDVRVRQALSLAIDRARLAKQVVRRAAPAISLVPPALGGQPFAPTDHAPAEARRLLAAAGFPGGRGLRPLSIVFNAHEEHRRVAEALQAMWQQELGLSVTLSQREWQVYLSDLAGHDFDLARLGWVADYADARSFLRDVLAADSPHNQAQWRDAEFARLLAASDEPAPPAERHATLARAEARVRAELPLLPLLLGQATELVRPYVVGWERNAQGTVWLDRVRLVDQGLPPGPAW